MFRSTHSAPIVALDQKYPTSFTPVLHHVREEAQMLTVIAGVILVGLLLILVVISLIADELPHETHEKRHD